MAFQSSNYTADEGDGYVEIIISLTKPLPDNFSATLILEDSNVTSTREL